MKEQYPERQIITPDEKLYELQKEIPGISIAQATLIYHAWTLGAAKLEEKKLRHAGIGQFYFTNREEDLPNPGYFQKINDILAFAIYEQFADLLKKGSVDYIIGVPNAGNKIAQCLEEITGIHCLEIEKRSNNNDQPKLNKAVKEGETVFLAENTITTGGSVYNCIRDVQFYGLDIVGIGAGLLYKDTKPVAQLNADGFVTKTAINKRQLLQGGSVLGIDKLQGKSWEKLLSDE